MEHMCDCAIENFFGWSERCFHDSIPMSNCKKISMMEVPLILKKIENFDRNSFQVGKSMRIFYIWTVWFAQTEMKVQWKSNFNRNYRFLKNERYFHHGYFFTVKYTYGLQEKRLTWQKKVLLAHALQTIPSGDSCYSTFALKSRSTT